MLVDDFKAVLTKAWSIRLAIVSAVFSAAEVALPYLPTSSIAPGTLAAVAGLVAVGAAVSRLIAQPRIHDGDPDKETE